MVLIFLVLNTDVLQFLDNLRNYILPYCCCYQMYLAAKLVLICHHDW